MEAILKDFNIPGHPDLMVGIQTRDDAGVFKLNEQTALIQTLDFFTPMVDDPFIFGQIAAVNALNDVYAMGGRPLLAMNIVCFPDCEDMSLLSKILQGGLDKINEAEAVLVGGHSVDDQEPKYGLAVTGIVNPQRLITNSGAKPGDLLFLTKPLGTGVIATSIKAEMASTEAYEEAVHWMTRLNQKACEAMQAVGVNAATDVTGFGLVGHTMEVAASSGVSIEIWASRIKFIKDTLENAAMGLIPGGAYANRQYLKGKTIILPQVDPLVADLLFSPETAGGLLIAVGEEKADSLLSEMKERECWCYQVGRVLGQGLPSLTITSQE